MQTPQKLPVESAQSVVRRLAAKALPEPALSKVRVDELFRPRIDTPPPTILELLYARWYFGVVNDVKNNIEGKPMNPNTKTTVAGFVAALGAILGLLGVAIPAWITEVVTILGTLALGYFAAGVPPKTGN